MGGGLGPPPFLRLFGDIFPQKTRHTKSVFGLRRRVRIACRPSQKTTLLSHFEQFSRFLAQILKTMAQVLKEMAQILKTMAQIWEKTFSGSRMVTLLGPIFEAFGGRGAEKVEKKRLLGKAPKKERQTPHKV